MTQFAGCVFLCFGLILAADKAKVSSLDHRHASHVPAPTHGSSSEKELVDAKNARQSWMDRFDAALRSLIIPETVKIVNAYDAKGAGHEIEADGDLEGSRLKRESANDAKMKEVSENDEKLSAGVEKKAEVKKKTKEKAKEINEKETHKDKEVRGEKKGEEKNENARKEKLEKKAKTHQNLNAEEYKFDTGNMKRSKFSDSKRDSRAYRSANGKRYLEIRSDEAGNVDDEEEYELGNLMRQRKFKSRLARDDEDRRSRRNMRRHDERRRRRNRNGDGGKFPRRYLKQAGDNNYRFYRHRRYYDRVNPFNLGGEEAPMDEAYRDDALGEDLRQRGRRHDDDESGSRSRRSDEDAESINEKDEADVKGYEGLVRRTRTSENADNEDTGNIRNTRDLNDDDDNERKLRSDNEDRNSDDEQGRFVRLSGSDDDEEDIKRHDERMKKRWADDDDDDEDIDDDEMSEERRRRGHDDEDEDAYLRNRFMRRSVVDGSSEGRDVDRQKRVAKDEKFYEEELPRGMTIRRGKRRPVWKSMKRRPIDYWSY